MTFVFAQVLSDSYETSDEDDEDDDSQTRSKYNGEVAGSVISN